MTARDHRPVALAASVTLGGCSLAIAELLSLMGHFHRAGIAAAWMVAGVIGGAILLRRRRSRPIRVAAAPPAPRGQGPAGRDWLTVAGIAGLAVALGCMALLAPPNTWDSMTYHMSRVAHWLQNESVSNFPTHISRQLMYPPFAETVIAQLQALTGSDRLAGLVQWSAYVGSVIGVSLIAKRLGGDARTQLLAAALAASVPVAVIQASGTKNDLVVGFWLVCAVCFVLDPRGSSSRAVATLIGTSLGLALATKFTGYIFGPSIAAWWLIRVLRTRGLDRRALELVAISALMVAAVNLPHVSRTVVLLEAAGWKMTVGSPMYEDASGQVATPPERARSKPAADGRWRLAVPSRHVNQIWDPLAWTSNLTRNAALHLALPGSAADGVNAAVRAIHRWLGADPNDPDTTYPPNGYRGVRFSMHEDSVGSPLHFVIALVCLGLLASARARRSDGAVALAATVAGAAFLFCLLLKWQPWHGRLHLPLFLLCAPLSAGEPDQPPPDEDGGEHAGGQRRA